MSKKDFSEFCLQVDRQDLVCSKRFHFSELPVRCCFTRDSGGEQDSAVYLKANEREAVVLNADTSASDRGLVFGFAPEVLVRPVQCKLIWENPA